MAPLGVAGLLRERLFNQRTTVLTSATLALGGSFDTLAMQWGLPPGAPRAEKAAGTAHVAIGRNTGGYGGVNEASIHVDCIFRDPQVEVDGRPLQALDPHTERA